MVVQVWKHIGQYDLQVCYAALGWHAETNTDVDWKPIAASIFLTLQEQVVIFICTFNATFVPTEVVVILSGIAVHVEE